MQGVRNADRKGADQMSDERQVLVIEYGKESFVHYERWAHGGGDDPLIVNGRRDWPKAAGDDSFRVVRGKVATIERFNAPLSVTVKHELRSDLVCANKPRWVRPDEYDRLPDGDRSLYSPVKEQREQNPTPLPMRVVNGLAAPRAIPGGIAPILPHHVNVAPWFWWTLACRASGDYVYAELLKRVEKLDPSQFAVTAYCNIKHMRVEARSFSLGGVEFRPSGNLLYIDRGAPAIDGENLDDVLQKVSAWCDDKMRAVEAAMSVTSCPCCKGKLPKGAKPKITARDPKHRNGHDISRH